MLSGFILLPDPNDPDVLHALEEHIKYTREEPGCITFQVVKDKKQAQKYHVYEVFENQHSFDAHQDRTKKSKWGKISRSFERNYKLL